MYENPETNIEPTSSTADKEDNVSSLIKAPDEGPDAETNETIAITEDVTDASAFVQRNDSRLDEIKIVSVASAATDDSIKKIISDEQEADSKSIESINDCASEPESTRESAPAKPPDDRGETRVISLDTIIRKGLNEQMPMTAKDIDNIVPNAIKQQQDANLKQSEKLANEKEFALIYESSDDYNSSADENVEDELAEAVNPQEPNEEEANDETEASEKIGADDQTPQSMCEALLEDQPRSDAVVAADPPGNDVTEKLAVVEAINANSHESDDSSASEHSFDDFDSESDSTHSSHKKRKRRKSAATQNTVRDDASKKSDEIGEDAVNDPGPRLNRRGKPRKSYDETDNDQVKKKMGRKLKIQRYAGPKRPGVRVSNFGTESQ